MSLNLFYGLYITDFLIFFQMAQIWQNNSIYITQIEFSDLHSLFTPSEDFQMTVIEIIAVRLSNPKYESNVRRLYREIGSKQATKTDEVVSSALLHCPGVSTDWSIHLQRETQQTIFGKTNGGRMIAEFFQTLGLVNHSVWEQA